MISNYKDSIPYGLTVYFSEEGNETIAYREYNRLINTIYERDIEKVKETEEYNDLLKFYEHN